MSKLQTGGTLGQIRRERERGELMVGVKRIKECLREILP